MGVVNVERGANFSTRGVIVSKYVVLHISVERLNLKHILTYESLFGVRTNFQLLQVYAMYQNWCSLSL